MAILTFDNGETGLSVRTKINNNFVELSAASTLVQTNSATWNSGGSGTSLSTVTNYLSTNNVSISALNIQGAVTETKVTPTISTNTLTLDLAKGTFFYVNLNSNINTISLTNTPASPKVHSFNLQFIGDGTARTVIWPSTFRWAGGKAPTLTSSSARIDTFSFVTHDGGTNWFAFAVSLSA